MVFKRLIVVAVLCGAVLSQRAAAAKTDITVEFDKTFSFAGIRTWTWHPEGAGDVRLALSADSDPKKVAARVEPVLVPMIEREMQARGFTKADKADLYVHYYVLATVGQTAQVMGQFVAPLPEWGLPPFAPQTTSLEIYPVGTLILDLTSPARRGIIWRGSAARKINLERSEAERREVLDKAVKDLIKRIPQPKKGS